MEPFSFSTKTTFEPHPSFLSSVSISDLCYVLFCAWGTADVRELMFKAAWSHMNSACEIMDPTWLWIKIAVADPPKLPSIFLTTYPTRVSGAGAHPSQCWGKGRVSLNMFLAYLRAGTETQTITHMYLFQNLERQSIKSTQCTVGYSEKRQNKMNSFIKLLQCM